MEFDVLFNGLPSQFAELAHNVSIQLWQDERLVPMRTEMFEVRDWEHIKR
jgi:hypothetical protein